MRHTAEGLLAAAKRVGPAITLFTAASAGILYLANHALLYNLAHLVTSEQLQKQSDKQSEQLQKQSDKQSEQLQKQSDQQSEQLRMYSDQLQRQNEQLQRQNEQLRADLRADLRTVPVLEGRTEELSKATAALLASRERRPWW